MCVFVCVWGGGGLKAKQRDWGRGWGNLNYPGSHLITIIDNT